MSMEPGESRVIHNMAGFQLKLYLDLLKGACETLSMVDMKTAKYRLGDVSRAVGIPTETLKTWMHRRDALAADTQKYLAPDEAGDGPGRYAAYSLRTVLRIAVMVEQTKWGISPTIALQNACVFTDIHSGRRNHTWAGGQGSIDVMFRGSQPQRDAGELFAEGKTYLVLRSPTNSARVINILPGEGLDVAKVQIGTLLEASTLCIDLNEITQRVFSKLSETNHDADAS